ncbi:MAG: lipopolysaccharide heptosyltransferase II, partial [Candidatus Omnitrophica bacterium]|nr:lipopolysaccharide heptosyltransferase II [Candidatus Omnitrophota bacterium]
KSLFSIIRLIPELVKIIKKENIEIVHARSRIPAWIAYFACKKTNIPFITTCHGYYKKHPFSYVMGLAKLVIAPSNSIAYHMYKDFRTPLEKIRIVPRGLDLEKFKFIPCEEKKNPPYCVGMLGRITPLKGHSYFLRAMAEVVKEIPDLKILIVGSAPKEKYKEDLEILAKRLGLGDITEFIPPVKDISSIMAKLNVLVLSSIQPEAFGRVIIEAQASGVPVVATRIGGALDIIEDKKTGLLVLPFDVQGMANSIIKILKDKDLATTLSKNAYEKVKKNYTLKNFAESTLKVYEEAISNFKILLIKLSALGDVILFTPTLKLIRKNFASNYKISVLVGEETKEVLLNCPYIDELIVYDFKGKDKGLKGIIRLACSLKERNFDILVDFQNNYRSHILGFLAGIPLRYGFNRKAGFFLNRRVPYSNMDRGPLEHQGRILNILGVEFREEELELWPTKEDELYIDEFLNSHWLSSHTSLVGINIGASSKWQTKFWPPQYILKLSQLLSKENLRVVLTGTEKDYFLATELIEKISGIKPINACGKTTINQLICLIKRCKVYISADSAPLHIACAVKTPCIAIFGPTDPKSHLTLRGNVILLYKNLACSPCYKKTCRTKKCMYEIDPKEVFEAVERILK